MQDRISRADIDRICHTVSECLHDDVHVSAQGRNGYIGIDLHDANGVHSNLTIGTKREVYTYLQGMRSMFLIGWRKAPYS
ncbi:MAG: hypothetical protein H0U18_08005 [Pyrinomonadaceae bacterium]|nr:hypothetical protein [Pyrinomonadaceae bacterium]